MAHDQQQSLAFKLRKTKAALLAVSLTLAGILLIMTNAWLAVLDLGAWGWVHSIPVAELGATLFGTGFLGTLFEYGFQKDQENANRETFRRAIVEEAPAIRDAVIQGFAIHPEDLKRVANPDPLDDIAANVMSLRLGDDQFARELYMVEIWNQGRIKHLVHDSSQVRRPGCRKRRSLGRSYMYERNGTPYGI